jgi:hypothetical protein
MKMRGRSPHLFRDRTKSGWQTVGVSPDVKASKGEALTVALQAAQAKVAAVQATR